jgi:hypothetical protein
MPILVNLPDGSQASFPDGTPPETMKAAIQKRFPPNSPPAGAAPGSRAYADWAAAQARAGKTLPQVGPQPPSASDAAPMKRNADGTINLSDVLAQQTHTGAYAPPSAPQPDVTQNPLNSALPGPLGQLHNTIRAASQGAMEAGTLNLGDELYAGVTAPFVAAFDAAQGRGFDVGDAFQRRLAEGEQTDANLRSLNPGAYDVGQTAGAFGLMGKSGGRVPLTAEIGPALRYAVPKAAATGAAFGAAAGIGTPGSIQDRLASAGEGALVGGTIGAVGGKLASVASTRAPTPTVEQLLSGAKTAFKDAERTGVVIPKESVAGFKDALKTDLMDEGVITPSGKVAGFPKVAHALDMTNDFAAGTKKFVPMSEGDKQFEWSWSRSPDTGMAAVKVGGNVYTALTHQEAMAKAIAAEGNGVRALVNANPEAHLGYQITQGMTVKQAKTLRKAIASAAKSTDPEERFHGVRMLNQFDQFMVDNGGAAAAPWQTGRDLYHIGKKGQTIEGLIDAANRRSRKSVAVTTADATRNRFDNFVGRPKNLRGFKPEEVAALERVGNGTRVGNVAKAVGQLAPTTLGGLSVKGGIPFAVGNAIGGPFGGTVAAGTTLGLGYVGRFISHLSTKQQAELARVLVLNGGKLPKTVPVGLSGPVRKAIGNLIAVSGARSPAVASTVLQMLSAHPEVSQAN